jgi:hypothetical protein
MARKSRRRRCSLSQHEGVDVDIVIDVRNRLSIPEDVFREFVVPYMDDQTLMRTARSCRELHASITGNDREWASRSEKMGNRDSSFEEYRESPQMRYLINRSTCLLYLSVSVGTGVCVIMNSSYAGLIPSGVFFLAAAVTCPKTLSTDVIQGIRLLPSRISTCTKNCSSSLLNRTKRLLFREHRPESRSL